MQFPVFMFEKNLIDPKQGASDPQYRHTFGSDELEIRKMQLHILLKKETVSQEIKRLYIACLAHAALAKAWNMQDG